MPAWMFEFTVTERERIHLVRGCRDLEFKSGRGDVYRAAASHPVLAVVEESPAGSTVQRWLQWHPHKTLAKQDFASGCLGFSVHVHFSEPSAIAFPEIMRAIQYLFISFLLNSLLLATKKTE